ncbi:hypothetical protein D9756_010215 [Leucocoprinus leucothites]|uniref:Uncharacterized protein n=1 Tax=Leucocoprinus leucothites TaxID=201217 RepID=A0A8H5CTY1_9AGAR|nr:hypothetical protein D9756_010215 [Leucoagaricus leucothites]
MSSEAPTRSHRDAETRRLATKQSMPAWLPISIFVGTSLAIGIPILMFRKARATAFKMSLDNPSAAPPRRVLSSSPSPAPIKPSQSSNPSSSARRRFRPLPTTTASVSSADLKDSSSEWDSHPSLLTALSKSTTSNAFLAGKALFIATTLVGVGAFGLVSAVQHLTGAYTAPEFARLMRYWTDQHLRPITDRIHRSPENEEERKAALDIAAFGVGEDEEWTWEDAEKRMKRAYEEGGFSLWGQVALRELEAEARAERARRRREVADEAASRSGTFS